MNKCIFGLLLFLSSYVSALENEFFVVAEDTWNQLPKWFYIDSPFKHLGKVYEDYNVYTLYDDKDQIAITAHYYFGWDGMRFEFRDRFNNNIATLKNDGFMLKLVDSNDEKLFGIIFTIYSLYEPRPFVFTDPLDSNVPIPIGVVSNPCENFWDIQLLDPAKFKKVDERVLYLLAALLADNMHWR